MDRQSKRKDHAIANKGAMNHRWLPLNALRAFEAVGKHLSFTSGAAALSVSQSAMSRHVSALEDLLGQQLFEREAGRLSLTPAGDQLLAVVGKSLERIELTMNAIRDESVPTRAMRLHVPPSLLQQMSMPMLGDFNPVTRCDHTHRGGFARQVSQYAFMVGRQVLDEHERHVGVRRSAFEEARERIETTRRRTDADDQRQRELRRCHRNQMPVVRRASCGAGSISSSRRCPARSRTMRFGATSTIRHPSNVSPFCIVTVLPHGILTSTLASSGSRPTMPTSAILSSATSADFPVTDACGGLIAGPMETGGFLVGSPPACTDGGDETSPA